MLQSKVRNHDLSTHLRPAALLRLQASGVIDTHRIGIPRSTQKSLDERNKKFGTYQDKHGPGSNGKRDSHEIWCRRPDQSRDRQRTSEDAQEIDCSTTSEVFRKSISTDYEYMSKLSEITPVTNGSSIPTMNHHMSFSICDRETRSSGETRMRPWLSCN